MSALRTFAALFVCAIAAAVLAPPAHAACETRQPLERAIQEKRDVFVGEVDTVMFGGRSAIFKVIEVWKGSIQLYVTVRGGSSRPGVTRKTDRNFQQGDTYLVVPHTRKGRDFIDDRCSATTRWRDDYEHLRPPGAPIPLASRSETPSSKPSANPIPTAEPRDPSKTAELGVLVFVLVVGGYVFVKRRNRPT